MDFNSVLIGGVVAPFVMWAVTMLLCILKIQFHGFKRAKSRVFDEYPFYKMPWYKKLLFLGLNGAIPKVSIVFAYIFHCLMILCVGVHIACLFMLQSTLLRTLSKIILSLYLLFPGIITAIFYNIKIDVSKKK